ncbi:MAG: UDP-N-acetylmuramoyl-tripeptide--D-alanyl-D-alanine ligase [Candidatus Uhrbacteria bacterium]
MGHIRRFLEVILAYLARSVIRRQRPFIVGVTGSVGKTSSREAIRVVLGVDRSVRAARKNYNNEIGLPMTILGGRMPGRSLLRWVAVFFRGIGLMTARGLRYPEALVLEYGADHPGDITYLLRIAKPDVSVITAIGPTHTEFFSSTDRVAAEKRKLVTCLGRDGIAVLNRDDERIMAMAERTRARVVTFGFHEEADVRAIEYRTTIVDGRPTGLSFKIAAGGSVVPVRVPGCLGRAHAMATLAAAATGVALGMHLVEIANALERYIPQPSRMRILDGIKNTVLIDDTYNSSPLAAVVALNAFADIPTSGRKIAILGDMLELGALTEREHKQLGVLAASTPVEYLICVGQASHSTAKGARGAGIPEDRVLEFARAEEAGRFVQDMLREGDIVLVKGSQSVRLEKVVIELMADPLKKEQLVCRQDQEWQKR